MIAMFVLIALHVPIGVSMALVGFVGTSLILGMEPALSILAVEPISALSSLDLATVPLFLLMGGFAASAGLASDLFNLAACFIGHRRGGLAMATVGGCAGFGAICGSSIANTATMSKVALPEMQKRGYSGRISAGSIAAGGSLAILIPPSIIMVIYAVLTEQFVLDLFIAGIVPGLLSMLLYIVVLAVYARRFPNAAPAGDHANWRQRWLALTSAWRAVALVAVVTFGIYAGVVTVTEAASLGVFATFAFWMLTPQASWKNLFSILSEAASVTGMIFMMVVGAHILSYFVTLTDGPNVLVQEITQWGLPSMGIILALLVIYLILGAVFEAVAAMVLTLPIVFPLIIQLGYDPIWWGIINVMIIEIAVITPPIGLNVFVMHASAPHLGLKTIYRGIMPFLAADSVRLALLLMFPAIATFLPGLLR